MNSLSKESNIEIQLTGLLGNMRMKIGNFFIMTASGRLFVEPAKSDEDVLKKVGEIASDIYNHLSHTPVQAIGNNFVFELDDKDEFAIKALLSDAHSVDFYKETGFKPLAESSLKHSLENRENNQRLNIAYDLFEGKKYLKLNYHYEVAEDKDKTRDALDRYFGDYKNAVGLKNALIERGNHA